MSTDEATPKLAEESSTSGGDKRSLVIAAISLVVLAGMLFGAALWILAGIAAAMIVALNFYLAQSWSVSVVANRIGGDREVKIQSRIPVQLDLRNRGRLPVLWVLVEDLLPKRAMSTSAHALEVLGPRVQVFRFWGGQQRTLAYEVTCKRRGYFQLGPTVLETGDLMGLFRRYRVTTQPQYVTVLPEVVPLTTYEIGSRRAIGEIRIRENVINDPTRLKGIRQWQPGDPMRSIHWAATARTGTLHSKVYEPSSVMGATLVLDLHHSTMPIQHEPVRSDLAVTAAASIANALHDANEPVGLATNGRDAADRIRHEGWVGDHRVRDSAAQSASMRDRSDRLRPVLVPASRGPINMKEIMRSLARLERTDGLTLSELLTECEGEIASETTLLVILQTAREDAIGSLIGLSRRGRAVAVIINTQDINDYSKIAGPLIGEHIPTFHLGTRDSIPDVCRATLVR